MCYMRQGITGIKKRSVNYTQPRASRLWVFLPPCEAHPHSPPANVLTSREPKPQEPREPNRASPAWPMNNERGGGDAPSAARPFRVPPHPMVSHISVTADTEAKKPRRDGGRERAGRCGGRWGWRGTAAGITARPHGRRDCGHAPKIPRCKRGTSPACGAVTKAGDRWRGHRSPVKWTWQGQEGEEGLAQHMLPPALQLAMRGGFPRSPSAFHIEAIYFVWLLIQSSLLQGAQDMGLGHFGRHVSPSLWTIQRHQFVNCVTSWGGHMTITVTCFQVHFPLLVLH